MTLFNLIYKTLRKVGGILTGGVMTCIPAGC